MFTIYYSRSNGVNDTEAGIQLQKLIENSPINRAEVQLTKHSTGKDYKPELVGKADLVVVGLGEYGSHDVGKGCYGEIQAALHNNIPVLVICKDGEEDRVFLQKVRINDIEVIDSSTWEIGYGLINLYDGKSYADDFDVDDEDKDINCCAWIDDTEELQKLFQFMYPDREWKFSKQTGKALPFKLSSDSDDELLLLLR